MDWRNHIIVDQRILTGKSIIKGTRISLELVVDLLAAGWSHPRIPKSYPTLKEDDVRACLAYASEILHAEKVFPPKLPAG